MASAYADHASADHASTTPATAETFADFGTDARGRAAYWKAEIKACDKEMEKWRERAAKVVKRYRDDRGDTGLAGASKKYNLLWSIINTTLPAVYGRPPEPIVMRRYTDPDQVARVASLILERTLTFQLKAQSDFHPNVKHALQDRLLPGMGCAWVRYQKAQSSPTGTLDNDYYARLAGNVAAVDFVYWEDFGFVPSRTWEEVPAVWRIVYLTRDELKKRFPDVKDIPLDYTPARHPNATDAPSETDEPKHNVFKQAKVYEIWDKRTSRVCWVHMGVDTLLDEKPDPMNFPGFFPCPRPMFATNTTGNLVPQPDYYMYQDQAEELDNITQRLDMLTKALKVVGLYDGGQNAIVRLLTEGVENELIPVDTWAAFAEKGGIKGVVDWLPIDQVIEVVQRLFEIRQQLIQDIYQITGLSDIIRGASNPNETLGAQQIKTQFASIRLDNLKADLARFVTDILGLMGHVVVSFFDDDTLIEQSAIMQSPDGQKTIKDAQAAIAARQAPQMPPAGPPGAAGAPPGMPPAGPTPPAGSPPETPPMPPMGGGMLPANVLPFAPPPAAPMPMQPPPGPTTQGVIAQALQLLRQGKLIDYRVEIASDSLVEPDLNAERQARNEFLTGVTQFLQQAMPAVQQNPQFLPIAQALLMFGIRGFRVGRDIEGVIEAAFDDMRTNPQPEKPDPKVQALEKKAELDQQAQQSDAANKQMEVQGKLQQGQQELQMKMEEMQATIQNEREKNQMEMEAFREKTMAEVQAILIKAGVQAQAARDKAAQDATIKSAEMQGEVVQNAQEMAQADAAHQQDMTHQAEQGELQLEQQKEAAKVKPAGGDDGA
jgi:hypothetical protein